MVTRDTAWGRGTPCWVDLGTTDPTAANEFYSRLFGWDIEVGGPETGNYAMCRVDGRAAAGIGPIMGEPRPPVWSTYLASDDLDADVRAAQAAGANVNLPPTDVMDVGRLAFLEVPGGGYVGFWQAGTRVGVEIANEPNTLVWNEFMTRDYAGAKAFYADVFGYAYTEIGNEDFHYSTIALPGQQQMVGGIGELPAQVPAEVPPHWRAYFSVPDCDATVALAVELGGRVVQQPQDMPFGRFADLADPQGATFSVVRPPTG